jgi:hypothetical protein
MLNSLICVEENTFPSPSNLEFENRLIVSIDMPLVILGRLKVLSHENI